MPYLRALRRPVRAPIPAAWGDGADEIPVLPSTRLARSRNWRSSFGRARFPTCRSLTLPILVRSSAPCLNKMFVPPSVSAAASPLRASILEENGTDRMDSPSIDPTPRRSRRSTTSSCRSEPSSFAKRRSLLLSSDALTLRLAPRNSSCEIIR